MEAKQKKNNILDNYLNTFIFHGFLIKLEYDTSEN
ncbi:hypothetical protein N201_05050 [Helicobacter pylori UM066]|nr:hypothetical protein N201_05050 [Helicobacter pylori UM066]